MNFSICMPSNRTLSESQRSIDSVFEYSKRIGCKFFLSDNSGDESKREKYESLGDNLIYMSGPDDATMNWKNSVSRVDTDFLCVVGDDDMIFLLDSLPKMQTHNDISGFRPSIVGWTSDFGVINASSFGVTANIGRERVVEYFNKNNGDFPAKRRRAASNVIPAKAGIQ